MVKLDLQSLPRHLETNKTCSVLLEKEMQCFSCNLMISQMIIFIYEVLSTKPHFSHFETQCVFFFPD